MAASLFWDIWLGARRVDFTGSTIRRASAGQGVTFQNVSSYLWSNLKVVNYDGLEAALKFVSNDAIYSFYKIVVVNPKVHTASGIAAAAGCHGITLSGVYETELYSPYVVWGSVTHNCIHMTSDYSSMLITAPNTRGGQHGIFVDGYKTDFIVNGGTILHSQRWGIYAEVLHCIVTGTHVENTGLSGSTYNAGIQIVGGGTLTGVVGVANTSSSFTTSAGAQSTNQRYAWNFYEGGNGLTVIGGTNNSNVSNAKTGVVEGGTSGSKISLYGVPSYDTNTNNVLNRLWVDGKFVAFPDKTTATTVLATASNNTFVAFSATHTVKANTLQAGSRLRMRAMVTVNNASGTDTLTCELRFGGTTLVASTAVDPGATTDHHILEFELTSRAAPSAGSAVVGSGSWSTNTSGLSPRTLPSWPRRRSPQTQTSRSTSGRSGPRTPRARPRGSRPSASTWSKRTSRPGSACIPCTTAR